jgi:putative nucleotidyltransferase with HDIG domain
MAALPPRKTNLFEHWQVHSKGKDMESDSSSPASSPLLHDYPEPVTSPEPIVQLDGAAGSARLALDLRLVFSASTDLMTTRDWEVLLHKIVRWGVRLTNADQGSLMIADESSDSLFIASAHNLAPEVIATTRVQVGDGIVGWVAQNRQPLLLLGPVSVEQYPRSFPKPELVTSSICVPIASVDDAGKSKLLGVLSLSRQVGSPHLAPPELELVAAFSSQAAAAMQNTRAHQLAQQRVAQSEHLIQVSRNIAESLDTDIVLQSIMDRAVELLRCQSGSLLLVDPQTNELVFQVVVGPARGILVNHRLPAGVGIVGTVAREGKPLIVNDAKADPRHYGGIDSSTALRTRSLLCVPLMRNEKAVGVLEVMNKLDGTLFDQGDSELLEAFATQSAIALGNAQLYSDLKRSFADTVRVIANAVEARDPYTAGHTGRVTQVALEIARELNWQREQLEILEIGAVLHDIGKIGVSDKVLRKPDQLTEEEYAEMKQHPIVGARMLTGVAALRPMLSYVLYHQERYDGKGYPFGLAGKEIPMEGRLLAVADTFDAMTSNRPYRAGLSEDEAIAEIVRHRGTQFDPEVVDALLAVYQKGKLHAVIQGK